MKHRKFNLGQSVVRVGPSRSLGEMKTRVDGAEQFIISRLLPMTGFNYQYRIKAHLTGRERVALEDELTFADPHQDGTR